MFHGLNLFLRKVQPFKTSLGDRFGGQVCINFEERRFNLVDRDRVHRFRFCQLCFTVLHRADL